MAVFTMPNGNTRIVNPEDQPDNSLSSTIKYYVGGPDQFSQYERIPTTKGYYQRLVARPGYAQQKISPGATNVDRFANQTFTFVPGDPYPDLAAQENLLSAKPAITSNLSKPLSGIAAPGGPVYNGVPVSGVPAGALPADGLPAMGTLEDPLLSPDALMAKSNAALGLASKPITDSVNSIVDPQLGPLKDSIQQQTTTAKASAQSDFARRGLTGSSTEIQTLTRDIPAGAAKALAEAQVKLIADALPVALQDKALNVDALLKNAQFGLSLRNLVSDEKFKMLDLQQRDRLAHEDQQLQITLRQIDQQFAATQAKLQRDWQTTENDKQRAQIQAQLETEKDNARKNRIGAIVKGLATVSGMAIGAALAPATGGTSLLIGAGVGGMIGGQFGGVSADSLGFLLD